MHAQAQKAAIEAYVTGDGFDSQVGGILDSSVNDAQSAAVYSDVVVHTLKAAMNQLHVVTSRLATERATQARTTAAAATVPALRGQGAGRGPGGDVERPVRPEPGEGTAHRTRHKARAGDRRRQGRRCPCRRQSRRREGGRCREGRSRQGRAGGGEGPRGGGRETGSRQQ